jgi:hypothetical protein
MQQRLVIETKLLSFFLSSTMDMSLNPKCHKFIEHTILT